MEDSAFQAIYTGVYIFVFIAALTTTLYMFKNVNELAENSYNYGKQVSGQAVIEAPIEEETYLTEDDVISYYYNYVKRDVYADPYAKEAEVTIKDEHGDFPGNLAYKKLAERVKGKMFKIEVKELYGDGKYHFLITKI